MNQSFWFSYLWFFPFFFFLLGYAIMHMLTPMPEMSMPSLMGMPLEQALITLSDLDINVRITDTKESAQTTPGSILMQTPAAKTRIKKGQTVYCVLAKKPAEQQTPLLIGKTKKEILALLDQRAIHPKIYYLDFQAPQDSCFAQSPTAGTIMHHQTIIIYLSSGKKKPVIWPSFAQKPVLSVLDFMHTHALQPVITHMRPMPADHTCERCVVVDQRPFAGSFIAPEELQKMPIQLFVR